VNHGAAEAKVLLSDAMTWLKANRPDLLPPG